MARAAVVFAGLELQVRQIGPGHEVAGIVSQRGKVAQPLRPFTAALAQGHAVPEMVVGIGRDRTLRARAK